MILRRAGCAMALNTTSVEVIDEDYIRIPLWARVESKASPRAGLYCVSARMTGNDKLHVLT